MLCPWEVLDTDSNILCSLFFAILTQCGNHNHVYPETSLNICGAVSQIFILTGSPIYLESPVMSFRFRVSSLNPSLPQRGSKWSHFSSSAGPSTLLYWRKVAFRDMQASLFYSTQWICLCLYRVVSLLLFTNTQKTRQCLWVVFYFLKSQLCHLFTVMLSYLVLPSLLLLPFWPTLRKAIFLSEV